ncbi:hypothetical protein DINM_001405 [Dirofilaria immitis]|nr:hypothetical protein [Dirofilaria immitis]
MSIISQIQPGFQRSESCECEFATPVMSNKLCGILLRFRLMNLAILYNTAKAFYQIVLSEIDRDVPTIAIRIILSRFLLAALFKHHLRTISSVIARKVERNLYVINVIVEVENEAKSISSELPGRIRTSIITIYRRNCLQINMLLPYYTLVATLPFCITQILTKSNLSVQAKTTVQLDLNECNRTNTNEKPFKCETCGKGFISSSALTRHNPVHTGERPFKCDVCGKSFNQRGNLKSHSLIHTGVKPYKCDVCGQSFNLQGNLNRHSLIHTGVKPYKCDVCGNSFNQRGDLNRHSLIHIGVKPHNCDVCGKSFNRRANLNKHSLIHIGVKPHNCDVCNKQFSELVQSVINVSASRCSQYSSTTPYSIRNTGDIWSPRRQLTPNKYATEINIIESLCFKRDSLEIEDLK